MKQPSVASGVGFAFLVAIIAVPVIWGLQAVFPFYFTVRVVSVIGFLGYLMYLLRRAGSRAGRLSLMVISVLLSAGLFFLPVGTPTMVVVLVAMTSVSRSLLYHRSLLSAALDGMVATLGFVFAGYLFTSKGSLAAALWGFFLVQSAFVLIPLRLNKEAGRSEGGESTEGEVDSFVHGHRQAELALERIIREGDAR